MSRQRDYSLDYLRGLGCICMVVGHFRVLDKQDLLASNIQLVASMSTLFFFIPAAINARLQVERHDWRILLKSYLMLALAGFSFNGVLHGNFYEFFTFELFQIIAVGAIAVVLFEHFIKSKNLHYLLIAIVLYGIKISVEWLWPDFHGWGILSVHPDYVPHAQLAIGEKAVYPGFPVLMWLFLFFWGGYVYTLSKNANLIIALSLSALAVVAHNFDLGIDFDWTNKWQMTPGYLIYAMILFCVSVKLVSLFPQRPNKLFNFLIFAGQNSLIFFFIHGVGLFVAANTAQWGQYVAWGSGFVVSYWCLIGVVKLKPINIFRRLTPWLLLVILVLALPLLIYIDESLKIWVIVAEGILGLIFCKHFSFFSRSLKQT